MPATALPRISSKRHASIILIKVLVTTSTDTTRTKYSENKTCHLFGRAFHYEKLPDVTSPQQILPSQPVSETNAFDEAHIIHIPCTIRSRRAPLLPNEPKLLVGIQMLMQHHNKISTAKPFTEVGEPWHASLPITATNRSSHRIGIIHHLVHFYTTQRASSTSMVLVGSPWIAESNRFPISHHVLAEVEDGAADGAFPTTTGQI
eukprot:jgi/Psemu1/46954/gm1.46954_g